MMERDDILARIPHGEAFLWIDRVAELEPGSRCVAFKSIGGGESFFSAHFPGNPVLPGVFLIEAVAQTAAVMLSDGEASTDENRIGLLGAVNRFKFLAPVKPPAELRIETRTLARAGAMALVEGAVSCGGQVVAKGELAVVSRQS